MALLWEVLMVARWALVWAGVTAGLSEFWSALKWEAGAGLLHTASEQ